MIISILLYLVLVLFLNEFFLKKKYLGSNTGYKHQLVVNKSVPLTGGIILFFQLFIFYLIVTNFLLSFFISIHIRIASRSQLFNFLKKRFFFQFLLILFLFIY